MLWPSFKTRPSLEGGIPLSPRHLRRWLKALPMLDMGESTRLLYNGLVSLNQTSLPPGRRVQNMELIRDSAEPVLHHLSRQFIARSLPLPPRGRKILRLLLRLHKELAAGYKLALTDSVHEGYLSSKLLAIAAHRSMRHMGMIHLQASQLYEKEPNGMWQEIHWLYTFAEEHRLTASLVKDASYHQIRQSSITDVYLQIILLALAMPLTLRQGEAERLSQFFENHADLATIESVPISDANNGAYLINLELDRPPAYTTISETYHLRSLRGIVLSKLLTHLREQLQGGSSTLDGMQTKSSLPPELARRLMLTLTRHSKRDFARSERIERIYVSIGLDTINRAIQVDTERLGHRDLHQDPAQDNSASVLHLQTISDHHRTHHNDDAGNYYDPHATMDDIWRLVADDALWDLNDPSSRSRDFRDIKTKPRYLDQNPPQEWAEWKLQNASPGGYCISWEQVGPARAQVGELIAMREREGYNSIWRIGIIRWIRNIPRQGLFAGIQLIAARSYLITVHSVQTLQNANAIAMDGLLLPEVKALRQPGSLILPAGHFQSGDEVVITEGANENRVRLMDRLQYSSSFAQFMISTMDTSITSDNNKGFDAI